MSDITKLLLFMSVIIVAFLFVISMPLHQPRDDVSPPVFLERRPITIDEFCGGSFSFSTTMSGSYISPKKYKICEEVEETKK